MKKTIFTLFLCGLAYVGFGQLKVISSGDTEVHKTLVVGQQQGTGQAAVRVGLNRSAVGTAMFDFYTQATSTVGDWQLRLSSEGASSNFSHKTSGPFRFKSLSAGASMLFFTNNIERIKINPGGQVDIHGSATVNGGLAVTSDRRLKSNIKPLERGLKELMEMKPVSFKYNGKGNTDVGRAFVGLVAQDLQKIAPEFVSEHVVSEVDDNGNNITEQTYLKIHDTELKYLMINAIQEQQELLEDKDIRIAELEVKLEELSEKVENLVAVQNVSIGGILPDAGGLRQNVPNPFSTETSIPYDVKEEAHSAKINIFDNNGRILKTITIDHRGQGLINLQTDQLPSGTYMYQLIVDNEIIGAKKMILNR